MNDLKEKIQEQEDHQQVYLPTLKMLLDRTRDLETFSSSIAQCENFSHVLLPKKPSSNFISFEMFLELLRNVTKILVR